jgi:hypothetical protein
MQVKMVNAPVDPPRGITSRILNWTKEKIMNGGRWVKEKAVNGWEKASPWIMPWAGPLGHHIAHNAPQYFGLAAGALGSLIAPGSGLGMFNAGTHLGKGLQGWHDKKYNTSGPGSTTGKVMRKMAKVAANNMQKAYDPALYQRRMKRKRIRKLLKHRQRMEEDRAQGRKHKSRNHLTIVDNRQAIGANQIPHVYTR